MSARNLRLPNSIDFHLKEIAAMEGVLINQLITTVVSEKVSALITKDHWLFIINGGHRFSLK